MTKRTSKFSKIVTDWVQIFAAGTHTDSKGQTKEWTTSDLDEMVANHNAQDLAPMVIGHPKHDSPAWGWIGALKREGEALFAKFDKVHSKFIEWGEAGHIHNRSVKILKTPKGFRVGHIGFLGAMAPAVEGMEALEFAADAEGDTYEFGWADGYRLGLVARMMRRMREIALLKWGQEDADNLVPLYEVEDLERAAAEEKSDPEKRLNHFNTPPNPETTVSTFTQQQLDDAVAKARQEEQAKHNATVLKLRAAEFSGHMAENRAFITGISQDEKGNVRLTPAQAEGWAECLTFAQLAEGNALEFSFTAGDQSEKKLSVYEFLKGKLADLPVQLKLGQEQVRQDNKLDLNDAVALEKAASEFVASEKEAGREITIAQAVTHIKAKHA
jgi:hypothetical protein